MLASFKKVISGDSDKKEKNQRKGMNSFAGMNKDQIIRKIENGDGGSSLQAAKLPPEVEKALKDSEKKVQTPEVAAPIVSQPVQNSVVPAISVASNSSLEELVATIFAEGQTDEAREKLKEYINKNRGMVEQRFWYMLLDVHQVNNDQSSFEKVALAFANVFKTSPPSWESDDPSSNKKGMIVGKNIMSLEQILKTEHTDKFKEFYKAAREEKFCRINVSSCKFEQSDLVAIVQLHKLFVDLRKSRVMSVLMGDNNLINFCKSYINPPANIKLREDFIAQDRFFWLIYLEILQWKGKAEEFENLAYEYAVKFEISPPGWDENGIMIFDKVQEEEEHIDTDFVLDKILTSINIQSLLNLIEEDFKKGNKSEIEFGNVMRVDFASAGMINHFIMEITSKEEHQNKQVSFKHPNEMILTLFDMVGVTEFVNIIPKIR